VFYVTAGNILIRTAKNSTYVLSKKMNKGFGAKKCEWLHRPK
jgi:hypothetical protein